MGLALINFSNLSPSLRAGKGRPACVLCGFGRYPHPGRGLYWIVQDWREFWDAPLRLADEPFSITAPLLKICPSRHCFFAFWGVWGQLKGAFFRKFEFYINMCIYKQYVKEYICMCVALLCIDMAHKCMESFTITHV